MSADTFASLWPVLTGEEMRQMADGRVPMPPHALHAGLAIERVEPGRVALDWRPPAAVSNPAGAVHGGYLAMALDDAAALACASLQDRFRPMLTLNLNLDFLRTVQVGEVYTVTGAVVHSGRRRIVAEAEVTGADGRGHARGTGSFAPNAGFDPRDNRHRRDLH